MVSLFLYPENRKDNGFLKGFLTFLIPFYFFRVPVLFANCQRTLYKTEKYYYTQFLETPNYTPYPASFNLDKSLSGWKTYF